MLWLEKIISLLLVELKEFTEMSVWKMKRTSFLEKKRKET